MATRPSNVGVSRGANDAATSKQQSSASQPAQQQSKTMLTQAQRTAGGGGPQAQQVSNGITFAKSAEELTPKQKQEYLAIQRQPKNRSPVNPAKYLPLLDRPMQPGKKTLVLDIDETLVHSSYERTAKYDLHVPCCTNPMRKEFVHVYVAFRPYLKEFLEIAMSLFEVVIFTASVEIYCRPLMEHLDPQKRCALLWRDHCTNVNGVYVKDLSLLGRDLSQTWIIDNSAHAYLFQNRNSCGCCSWFDNTQDRELRDLVPLLELIAKHSGPVYDILDVFNSSREVTYD